MTSARDVVSQTRIRPSSAAVASRCPSGENALLNTRPSCGSQVVARRNTAVGASEPVTATIRPFGETPTAGNVPTPVSWIVFDPSTSENIATERKPLLATATPSAVTTIRLAPGVTESGIIVSNFLPDGIAQWVS